MIRQTSTKQLLLAKFKLRKPHPLEDTVHSNNTPNLCHHDSSAGIFLLDPQSIHQSTEIWTNPYLYSINSKNNIEFGDVLVGKNTILGANSRVLPGSKIGEFPANPARQCVFVLSTGRAGSLSIAKGAQNIQSWRGTHESMPIASMLGFVRRKFKCGEKAIYSALKPRLEIAASTKGSNWLESDSRMFEFIKEISEILPQAKFIHLTRERESYLNSAQKKGGYGIHSSKNMWNHFQILPSWENKFALYTQRDKLKWYYDFVNETIIRDSAKHLSPESIMRINLEDDGKEKKINDFLGTTNFELPHLNKGLSGKPFP